MKDKVRVMDPHGQHMTFQARAVVNDVVIENWRTGHAYVSGLDRPNLQGLQTGHFYTEVDLIRVQWVDGDVLSSSGSSAGGTTPRPGSREGS